MPSIRIMTYSEWLVYHRLIASQKNYDSYRAYRNRLEAHNMGRITIQPGVRDPYQRKEDHMPYVDGVYQEEVKSFSDWSVMNRMGTYSGYIDYKNKVHAMNKVRVVKAKVEKEEKERAERLAKEKAIFPTIGYIDLNLEKYAIRIKARVLAPNTFAVESEAISIIAYDFGTSFSTGELTVVFKHGGVYTYQRVPQVVAVDFLRAESKGSFYQTKIKGIFDSEKVG